jgi:DNA polymerase-3 subunit beta
MEFTCATATLANALSLLKSIAPARSNKPVLMTICLAANKNQTLGLAATDFEVSAAITVAAEEVAAPKKGEKILLNAERFAAIVGSFQGEKLSFTLDGASAKISSAQSKFELSVYDEPAPEIGDIFSAIKEIDEKQKITIAGADFADAVARTKFAVSRDPGRLAFNGLCLNIKDDKIEFVSTDGSRMSIVGKTINNPNHYEKQAVVITKGIGELLQFVGAEEIGIELTDRDFIAQVGENRLVSRLIEATFPNYRNVIPTTNQIKVTVNRQALANGLRQIKALGDDEQWVTLAGSAGKVELTHRSSVASGECEIDAVIADGDAVKQTFHLDRFTDLISALREDEITLQFSDKSDKPLLVEEKDFTHVITPLRRD